jgi:hypothetical protein
MRPDELLTRHAGPKVCGWACQFQAGWDGKHVQNASSNVPLFVAVLIVIVLAAGLTAVGRILAGRILAGRQSG